MAQLIEHLPLNWPLDIYHCKGVALEIWQYWKLSTLETKAKVFTTFLCCTMHLLLQIQTHSDLPSTVLHCGNSA